MKVVQQQLGHQSATMTLDQYGHLFAHDLERIAEAMDSQLFTDNLSHGLVTRAQEGEPEAKDNPLPV